MLTCVVFTIPKNLHYGEQCVNHLRENGFDPILKVFEGATQPGIYNAHQSIMKNHWKVVEWFCENDFDGDLMVCEDDCEFVEKNAYDIISKHLQILHAEYKWSVFLPGQISYGPAFHTHHARLNRVTLSMTSHCYVLNGKELEQYYMRHKYWKRSGQMWTTPLMVEGWLELPIWQKFALHPAIATQNRQIKSIRRIPLLRDVSVLSFIRFFETTSLALPYVIVGILVYAFVRKLLQVV